jgi:hypothetical protein
MLRSLLAGLVAVGMAHGEGNCVAVKMINSQILSAYIVGLAKHTATSVFEQIDVTVRWGVAAGCAQVGIAFDPPVSYEGHPGALAYALPFGKDPARIHVFAGRVLSLSSSDVAGKTLGYTLAHEIGHVLERQTRHSRAGVMKANWDRADKRMMIDFSLRFSPEDVQFIHQALATLGDSAPERDVVSSAGVHGDGDRPVLSGRKR